MFGVDQTVFFSDKFFRHEKLINSKYSIYRAVKLLPFSYTIIASLLLLYFCSICLLGNACSYSSKATLVFIT